MHTLSIVLFAVSIMLLSQGELERTFPTLCEVMCTAMGNTDNANIILKLTTPTLNVIIQLYIQTHNNRLLTINNAISADSSLYKQFCTAKTVVAFARCIIVSKIHPPPEYTHPPFSLQVIAKGHLLPETTPTQKPK